MYTDIKTMDDANKTTMLFWRHPAFNMELARGLIAAADEMQAPLIILMGQAQMTKHARPELMVPMIKTLAEQTNVPVALILDHMAGTGRKLHGLTGRIFLPSWWMPLAYDMEENIARTKRRGAVSCTGDWQWRRAGSQARPLPDGCDVSLYTKPEEAVRFVQETGGTAWPLPGTAPWGLSQRLYPHH